MISSARLLQLVLLVSLILTGCSTSRLTSSPQAAPHNRTNVLLIVVDDMGFADLGSFGSEIPTPHLDQLAFSGVRFTNFITSSVCSPTRASLMTGVNPHIAGFGNLVEELAPNQEGQPGYEGALSDRVVTIATLLKDAGYRTYMTGKWHLGKTLDSSPWARGFERSFALLSNASHFSDMRPAYSPDPNAKASYRQDKEILDSLPDNFHYSSQFFADQLIKYIDTTDEDRPFFGFLAFSAPHWPIQAPDSAIAEFDGKYDEGYDVLAEARLNRQKRLGIASEGAVLSERPPKGQPWHALREDQRKTQIRAMEIYAAMIAEIDRHAGRVIDHLRERKLLHNTVVIFMSDNGAEGHDFDETWPEHAFPEIRRTIQARHDFSYENMGRSGSYTFLGPNWAHASAPSFYLHKGFASEGGLRTAAFAYSSNHFNDGSISSALITPSDIAATILQLAGVDHPGNRYQGRDIAPLRGRSVINSDGVLQLENKDRIHINETMGKIAVRQGEWKLTRMPPPWGTGDWCLFNMASDISESNDLAQMYPEIRQRLESAWLRYVKENGVILPNWASGY